MKMGETFTMKFGICTSIQAVAALPLSTVSFDFIEANIQQLLVPEQPQEDFEELLREARALPVPVETGYSFLPGDFRLVRTASSHMDQARLERYVRTVLRRSEQVGIRVICLGSAGARSCPEGHDHADALRQVEEYLATWNCWAREHGIQITLQPMDYAVTNVVNTLEEGAALISRIRDTGARLQADTFHMTKNHDGPEELRPVVPLLGHFHVAEFEGRSAPGVHGEDFRPYFSILRQGRYDQRIAIECNWHDFAAEVGTAIAVLREQWEDSEL